MHNDVTAPRSSSASVWLARVSEPGLFSVGWYAPDGRWEAWSDHGTRVEAEQAVARLNGGIVAYSPDDPASGWQSSGRYEQVAYLASLRGIGDECLISAQVSGYDGIRLHVRDGEQLLQLAGALALDPRPSVECEKSTHHYVGGTVGEDIPVTVVWVERHPETLDDVEQQADDVEHQADDDVEHQADDELCDHVDMVLDPDSVAGVVCARCGHFIGDVPVSAALSVCTSCGHDTDDHYGTLDNCHAVWDDGEPCGCGVE